MLRLSAQAPARGDVAESRQFKLNKPFARKRIFIDSIFNLILWEKNYFCPVILKAFAF
jgi:hypothetical protein